MTNNTNKDFIPTRMYQQIIKLLPIASVEAVIQIQDRLLFLKRNNEPAKGELWFPGGRIKKGESLEETLAREVKEETGLIITEYKFINVYSRVFPERHDITIVYLCKCKDSEIKLNNEHSEYSLLKKNHKELHQYILDVIADSKV